MIEVYLITGKDLCDAYEGDGAEAARESFKDGGGYVYNEAFNTGAEVDAFILGVNLANGEEYVLSIKEKDYKTIVGE